MGEYKTRVHVHTNGRGSTCYDVPDSKVQQFKENHRAEFQRINGYPCPARFRDEPLIKR